MKALEHKIPPPVLMFVIGLVMATALESATPSMLPVLWRGGLGGALFLAAGVFGFPAIRAFVQAKTTIDPVRLERASTLVTTGIFGITRNPMYVALTLLLCSWAALLGQPWPVIGPLCFALYIHYFQIIPEERVLGAKFGDAYENYCLAVRRWL